MGLGRGNWGIGEEVVGVEVGGRWRGRRGGWRGDRCAGR